jgi:hypothetical protein
MKQVRFKFRNMCEAERCMAIIAPRDAKSVPKTQTVVRFDDSQRESPNTRGHDVKTISSWHSLFSRLHHIVSRLKSKSDLCPYRTIGPPFMRKCLPLPDPHIQVRQFLHESNYRSHIDCSVLFDFHPTQRPPARNIPSDNISFINPTGS